jgi:Arc/MetJ-type ribon-helix-helix transcriptional regulator
VNSLGPVRKDSRKQAVSVRMSRNDVRNIKQLAKRLGARESDVIRFAIKIMLDKLAPLQDPKANGPSLVPVFMEWGAELMAHFDLDATRLSGIINDGAEDARQVEADDIQLIAMSGTQRSYLQLRLSGMRQVHASKGQNGMPAKLNGASHTAPAEGDGPEKALQRYLYEKYFYGITEMATNGSGSAP